MNLANTNRNADRTDDREDQARQSSIFCGKWLAWERFKLPLALDSTAAAAMLSLIWYIGY